MGMEPSHDLFTFKTLVDLIVQVHNRILCKCQIDAALPCVTGWQNMFDNDELFACLLIQTPITDQRAAHFHIRTAGVDTNTYVCGSRHKDRYVRLKSAVIIRRSPALRSFEWLRGGFCLSHFRRCNSNFKSRHEGSLISYTKIIADAGHGAWAPRPGMREPPCQ